MGSPLPLEPKKKPAKEVERQPDIELGNLEPRNAVSPPPSPGSMLAIATAMLDRMPDERSSSGSNSPASPRTLRSASQSRVRAIDNRLRALEEQDLEEEKVPPPQAFLPGQSMVTSSTPNVNDNNSFNSAVSSENPVCTICWDTAPPAKLPNIEICCGLVEVPGGRWCRCRDGQDVRVLPCGHSYHRACIKRWWVEADRLGQPRSCPTCRQQAPIKFYNAVWKSLFRRSCNSYVSCCVGGNSIEFVFFIYF